MARETSKLIVIGLDGATWQLIDPLIEQDRLPNLARLKAAGVHAPLQSCILPWTFPAWRVYSSGRNPGKLGVYWFSRIDWEANAFYFNDAQSYHGPDLWDYLNEQGVRTGVIDMPATYPPRPLDGFMVSGYPAEDHSDFTFPPQLKAELKAQFGYRMYALSSPDDRESYLAEQREIIRSRFAAARYLLEKEQVDFLHLTIFCIDQIQHRFWDDEGLFATWETLDDEIGRFVTNPDYLYFFMSDHGFGPGPITEVFQLNNWLAQEGYLHLRRHAADLLFRLGLTKGSLVKIAKTLHLDGWLRRRVSPSVRQAIPLRQETTGEAMMFDRAPLIDWDRSEVIADGHGLLYFNPSLPQERKQALVNEIYHKLEAMRSPITGLPIATKVYKKEEIYSGPFLDEAPEVILLGRNGCLVKDGVGGRQVFQPPEAERWNAKHAPEGIFLAWGKDINPSVTLAEASLVDLAPTLLHRMDCAVPTDMDGRVLQEIFSPESDPGQRKVVMREPLVTDTAVSSQASADNEAINERLKNLGYL